MNGSKLFALFSVALMLSVGAVMMLPSDIDADGDASVSMPVGASPGRLDIQLSPDGSNETHNVSVGTYVDIKPHQFITVYTDKYREWGLEPYHGAGGMMGIHGTLTKPGNLVIDVGAVQIQFHYTITLVIEDVRTYNVSFDSCGGNMSPSAVNGENVTLPSPGVRAGMSFDGWYTAANGGYRAGGVGDNYAPNSDVKLYARWSYVPVEITSTPPSENLVAGNSFGYTVQTSVGAKLSITGPSWLSVSGNKVVGTTSVPGIYDVVLTAKNGSTVDTQSFQIVVIDRLTFESAPTGSILVSGA